MPETLRSVRFAVVDVETSGLSARRHRVLQVGVVVVDGAGRVIERWSSLLRPRRRLLYRVGPRRLHGIDRRSLRHAPDATGVLRELSRHLEGAVLVAHNVEFDVAFLRAAAQAVDVPLTVGPTLCTLQLSRRLDPDRRLSHRLADLCARYGVEHQRPHDALADADATAAVLMPLLEANGITSPDQLAATS